MCSLLEGVGCALCALLALKLGLFLINAFNFLGNLWRIDLNKIAKGKWAVVTGATDGIGKAYARVLAQRGLNIVLVSRSMAKLKETAIQIQSEFQVNVQVIDIDFAHDSDSVYVERLSKFIKELEIMVLVNNVGMSYEHPEEFLEIDGGETVEKNILAVNVTSMNALTRLILPEMASRGTGVIINVSSFSGLCATPLLTVYSASKAYVIKLTQGLEMEYRKKGITFQCLTPAWVTSKMSKVKKSSFLIPTPETYVESALGRLGVQSMTTGYWAHEIFAALFNSLPESLLTYATYNVLNKQRAKAHKKKNM